MTAESDLKPRPLDPAGLSVLSLPMHDPRARPLLDELAVEYDSRYGDLFGRGAAADELNRYPASEFRGPGGAGGSGGPPWLPQRLPDHRSAAARSQAPVSHLGL